MTELILEFRTGATSMMYVQIIEMLTCDVY